jgi:hypothetical protein
MHNFDNHPCLLDVKHMSLILVVISRTSDQENPLLISPLIILLSMNQTITMKLATMQFKYQYLMKNQTWNLISLPFGCTIVHSKWVFKLKIKCDGSIDHYKTWLISKGFSSCYVLNYDETYAHMVNFDSICTILSTIANKNMNIIQLDVCMLYVYTFCLKIATTYSIESNM